MRTLHFPRTWHYLFLHAETPMHRAAALAEEALLSVHFATLPEPRLAVSRIVHPLLTIVGIALVGMRCGSEGWDEIEIIAQGRED
ncbi:MAG: Tnp 1-associated [Myxococcaceae bacterium]|nr:Tnp 1-associated [Myxococcaceae bacterium]